MAIRPPQGAVPGLIDRLCGKFPPIAYTRFRPAAAIRPRGFSRNISGVESAYAIMKEPIRLAVLGAGHVGPVIARLAIKAGYSVAIATSGDPEDIALITELVIPGAQPRWASDAIADADIVVLAIPLHRFLDIDPTPLDGKIVVDAMNYWPASDGILEPFEGRGSTEVVAGRLAGSAVVKALNHIGYHELEDRARPADAPDRRAAGVAGDDPAAAAAIAGLVDWIGYDPVRLASLRAGRVLQPGGPVFGVALARPEFERAVRQDARSLA
jgi:predicted dinucleotide-binding enzyme